MSIFDRPDFLRNVLLADAATCIATGLLLSLGTTTISGLTLLPSALVGYSGLILLPIAAFMIFAATRRPVWSLGVLLVIIGNVGWVVASLLVLGLVPANGLGVAFVLAQALVVAVLATLEFAGLRRQSALA